MEIDVLGTPYTIALKSDHEDVLLRECNGYCDHTVRAIVVLNKPPESASLVDNWPDMRRAVFRHELTHAFLFESGLSELARNEEIVEWIAVQFPKLLKAFAAADALPEDSVDTPWLGKT